MKANKSRLLLICLILFTVAFVNNLHADNIIILVKTEHPASSHEWTMGTKIEKYISNRTVTNGNFGFVKTGEANCERRSSKTFDKALFYGEDGHTPPGIFFLDFYREDLTHGNIRYRLALSDHKGGINIVFNGVDRGYLQMHEIYRDYSGYDSYFSKGCIVFDKYNFHQIFPDSYFVEHSSPFSDHHISRHSKPFQGEANILVFITDKDDSELYNSQIDIFDNIINGQEELGLKLDDFESTTPNLIIIREAWKTVAINNSPAAAPKKFIIAH